MIIPCKHCNRKILLSRGVNGQELECPHCHARFVLNGLENTDTPPIVSNVHIVVDQPTSRRTLDRVTVIHITGPIDTPIITTLKDTFDEQIKNKNTDIILDMAGVPYINSMGMGLLARTKNDLINNFGDLKLCGVRDNVRRLMKVVGLLTLFDFYPTMKAAQQSFNGDYPESDNENSDEPNKMSLIKCRICGKTSDISNHDRCKSYLRITRNYVWDHKNSSIDEVAKETGVPEFFVRTIVNNNWFTTSGGFYTEINK